MAEGLSPQLAADILGIKRHHVTNFRMRRADFAERLREASAAGGSRYTRARTCPVDASLLYPVLRQLALGHALQELNQDAAEAKVQQWRTYSYVDALLTAAANAGHRNRPNGGITP